MRQRFVDWLWRKDWYDYLPEDIRRLLPLPTDWWKSWGVTNWYD